MDPRAKNLSWDFYAGAIVALFAFFQLLYWPLSPRFLDIYYHLSVMEGFSQAGGYTIHAFWEFAPVGRPHLYPPLLHILMLALFQTGLSEITIGRIFECALYPLLLLTIWRVSRHFFGRQAAFFIVLLFSSVYSLYLSAVVLPAFTLSTVLALWGVFLFDKRRLWAATLLLGLSFYSHVGAATLWAVAFVLYGLFEKRLSGALRTVLGAAVLASPFLLYLYSQRQFFAFQKVQENAYLEIDLLVYLLAAAGIFLARKEKGYFFSLSLLLALSPMVLTHSTRALSGMGMLGTVTMAGLALNGLYEKKKWPVMLLLIVLFFSTVAPVFHLDRDTGKKEIRFGDRTVINFSNREREQRANEYTIYHPKHYGPIVDIIRENSAQDDLIWFNLPYAGGLTALLADRATSSAMLAEVKPFEDFDPLASAKLVVWFKDPEKPGPLRQRENVLRAYGFESLAETEWVYIDRNPAATAKKTVAPATVPSWMITILLLGILAAVIYNARSD